jgi:putative acetyltransferase
VTQSISSPRIVPRRDVDWPALLDLWVSAWRATYSDVDFESRRDWLKAHIDSLERSGARTLLLLDGSERSLVGFVVVDPVSHWLDQICVRPTHFGSGAAEALLEAARSLSPARLRLDVNADNIRAVAFYERQGFVKIADGGPSMSGRKTIVMEWSSAAP